MWNPDEDLVREDDLLQAQYEMEAREYARLRAQGWCMHSSSMGRGDGRGPLPGGYYYEDQARLAPGQRMCTDGCGLIWNEADYGEWGTPDPVRKEA